MTTRGTREEAPTDDRFRHAADTFMDRLDVPDPDLEAIRSRARQIRRSKASCLHGLAWQVPAGAAMAAGLLLAVRTGLFAPVPSGPHLSASGAAHGAASLPLRGQSPVSYGPAALTSTAADGPVPSALLVFAGRTYRLAHPDTSARLGPRLGTGRLSVRTLPLPNAHVVDGPLLPPKSQGVVSAKTHVTGTGFVPAPVYRLPAGASDADVLVRIPRRLGSGSRHAGGQPVAGSLWVAVPVPAPDTLAATNPEASTHP